MGTTLTGKKIKDTYKSLIKVSDNSEADSSAKQLSDGNGNDFGLYIDTDGTLGIGGSATYVLDIGASTDAVRLPKGTTVQQPTGAAGIIRYNTTTSKIELYDSSYKNVATENYVSTAINNLIDSSPATLDTLNESAAALNDDPDFHTTITALINAKQDTITGAATTITGSDLTADKAVVSNGSGKIAVSAVTSTELGYLSGTTSSVQTQINGKQNTLTAGTGIDITSDTISTDLSNLVDTGALQSDAVTAPKIAQFDDNLSAATAGHILVSDGTDFTNVAVSGDVTIASNGAVTIASDAVEASMIEDNVQLEGNESVGIPSGTTAQRPSGTAGQFRYNTTTNEFEGYTDQWGSIGGGGNLSAVRQTHSPDGSTLAFAIGQTITDENNVFVYIDGVYQNKSTFSVSGSTLTFGTGNEPPSGSSLEIMSYGSLQASEVANNSITSAKVGNEFKTSSALTAGATVGLDYTSAQVFTLTPNASTTINITNPVIGVSKSIIVTGAGSSYTLTFNVGGAAGTFNKISGDYDDTSGTKNFIQLTCVSPTEFWYSISQTAS